MPREAEMKVLLDFTICLKSRGVIGRQWIKSAAAGLAVLGPVLVLPQWYYCRSNIKKIEHLLGCVVDSLEDLKTGHFQSNITKSDL